MPRNTERPLNADEQRFIRHYVRERDLEKAEKKARLKSGQGFQFYKRKEVRADIDRRLRDIEHEQAVLDAKDIARREETISDLLDPELCKAIKLDAEKHGVTKLNAIRLGLIVSGRIRQGNTEALDRTAGAQSNSSSVCVYESVFVRRHQEDAPVLPAAPASVGIGKQPEPPQPSSPPNPPGKISPNPSKLKPGIRVY